VTAVEIPAVGSAEVHVLHEGYVGLDGDDERVSGTATLVLDQGAVIAVDPGMVADRGALLAALAGHGPQADQDALAESRRLLESFADVIIWGHGGSFRPGTPA
jgi:hypothetical protein